MAAPSSVGANVANRLDRLPISAVHIGVVVALSFAYFFELGDLNTFAYAAPALIKQWHLSVATVGFITSASFLGMFIGATGGGWVADRIGRKRALLWMVSLYSLFSLLNALSWDPASLGLFRFLTGVGLSAMTIVANTYISEFFPANSRGKYQALCMTFGLIGIPATSWVARLLIPLAPWAWRLVFVWGALGAIFLILASRMEESPRWYEIHGDFAGAEAVMQRIEQRVAAEKGPLPPPPPAGGEVVVRGVPYGELFNRTYVGRTVLLLAIWIFQTLGFYGFVSWVPTLLVKHGFSVVSSLTYSSVIALAAPLGALLAFGVADWMDRKWSLALAALAACIFGLLYGLTFQPALIMVFGFLVTLVIQCFAPLVYAYTPELYPTEARASGTGLTYGIGRLVNIVGPLIVSALYVSHGYGSVFVYVGACWVIVALAAGLFGPRTRHRRLEALSQTTVGLS